MCGIVGYTGTNQAAPILLHGLERLEYRGYDSAGMSVYSEGVLEVRKTSGKLENLVALTDSGKKVTGTCGIGHTRWATHGQPSNENSHPHLSQNGKIAIVHNGIIENYMKLKEMLLKCGVKFTSETDTEVIAQLIDYYYEEDLLEAVSLAVSYLEGSYALAIMSAEYPDTLIAVRKESPLVIAGGIDGNYLASDVAAILSYTRDVIYLDDGDMAVMTGDRVTVYDMYMQECEKGITHIDWSVSDAEKGGYEHFMIKEINEQPRVFGNTISGRIRDGEVDLRESGISGQYFDNIDRVVFIGCGSAYHAGVVGKYVFEKYVRIHTEVILASEFRYCEPLIDERTMVIVISQSGETLDSIAAMREAKRRGARTLSIVNVVGSTIAKESDNVIYTMAGPEIAVATTKAYSTQLAVIYMLTLTIGRYRKTIEDGEYREIVEELSRIPEKIQSMLDNREDIQYFASLYFNNSSIFFLGRNLDYAISLEGSLKLKEISYIHSEAYAGGELKHGTISLIEPGSLVVALATHVRLFEKLISNIAEVKARGAEVLGITQETHKSGMEAVADHVFTIPVTHEMLVPSLANIPLQLFSYYVALMRGCDIDKPRNLAKSVTVE